MAFTKVATAGINTTENFVIDSINSIGVVTASSFSGPISGTASLASGLTGTPDISIRNITGIAATFTGVVTYEDVTNIDSLGIITARSGIHVGPSTGVGITFTPAGGAVVSGVSTFNSDLTVGSGGETTALGVRINSDYAQIRLPDGQTGSNKKGNLFFGDGDDFRIVFDAHHTYMKSETGDLYILNSGGNTPIKIKGNNTTEVYHATAKVFETTSTGVSIPLNLDVDGGANIAGGSTIDQVNVTGVSTFTGSIDANGALDVDGQTDLDVLNVAEAATFSGAVKVVGNSNALQVQSTGEVQLVIGSTNAGGAGIYLDGDSNGDWTGSDYSHILHNTSGDMEYNADNPGGATNHIFKTAGSERLRIKSDGNIQLQGGIIYGDDGGTGTFKLQNTSGNSNHARIEIGAIQSSDNGGIHFYTAGSSTATRYMTLKGGGNLGLGIDNPLHNLHIYNAGTANAVAKIESESGYDARLQLDTSNGGGAGAHIDFVMDGTTKGGIEYTNNASSADVNCMIFRTKDNTERLRIQSSGINVTGITTSKSYDLSSVSDTFTLALNGGSDGSDTTNSIFVYDTRKDSDGGAWRKRTTDTAWYNEPSVVGVTTWCGTRAEFPSVAVIVGASNGIFIHDGDDPDLPLWRSYAYDGGAPNPAIYFVNDNFKITAKNGIVAAARNANEITNGGGLHYLDFILDKAVLISANYGGQTAYDMRELTRASMERGSSYTYGIHMSGSTYGDIQDANAISVDMAVLPNAPTKMFGSERGISTPTIAVGLNNGVTVINHHGNPYDLHGSSQTSGNIECTDVSITEDGYIAYSHQYATEWNFIPKVNTTSAYYNGTLGYTGRITNGTTHDGADKCFAIGGTIYTKALTSTFAITRSTDGLTLNRCVLPGFWSKDRDRRTAIIRYNSISGWMVGDCRMACLASADSTDLTNGQTDPSRETHYANSLTVTGTVTKTVVATGAELMGYSGWSSSNYLSKSYDGDFSFGETQFTVMFWAKDPSDTPTYVTARGDADATETWRISLDRNGGVYFDYGNGAQYAQTSNALRNEWAFYVCTVHAGEKGHVYVNGNEQAYSTRNSAPTPLMNDTDWTLTVGRQAHTTSGPFAGSIALFRVSADVPSQEIIRKIYDDEKQLFLPNAKCTLTGTQNSITGMDYDDSTDTVHVGTSAGRSDFRGLVRINNSGTAVNSSISASGGLIIEE